MSGRFKARLPEPPKHKPATRPPNSPSKFMFLFLFPTAIVVAVVFLAHRRLTAVEPFPLESRCETCPSCRECHPMVSAEDSIIQDLAKLGNFTKFYIPDDRIIGDINDLEVSNKPSKPCLACEVVVLTHGQFQEGKEIMNKMHENRLKYVKKHDYCYLHFNLKAFPLHYIRYIGLSRLFSWHLRNPQESWVLLLDLDTAFTNFTMKIEDIVSKVKEKASLFKGGINSQGDEISAIFGSDMACDREMRFNIPIWRRAVPINSGVMFYRWSNFVREFAKLVVVNAHNQWGKDKFYYNDQSKVSVILESVYHMDTDDILIQCRAMRNKQQLPPDLSIMVTTKNRDAVVVFGKSFSSPRWPSPLFLWERGAFICHFFGQKVADREFYFEKVMNESKGLVDGFALS